MSDEPIEIREQAVRALVGKDGEGVDELITLIDDRVFQQSSMAAGKPRPFVVCKMGNANPIGWRNGPTDQIVELWIHDEPGDYYQIDRIVSLAKTAFARLPNKSNFLETRFEGVTPDLTDPGLETICRVARWTWALST